MPSKRGARPGGSQLTLPVPTNFTLRRAVCSYGYYLLAPNRWDPTREVFSRPLQANVGGDVTGVEVSQPGGRGGPLRVACADRLSPDEQRRVRHQVVRVLRLDEDLRAWARVHPRAWRRGYGWLFRSPTLFEDMVKTITGCNVTWRNTITMNRLLTEHVGGGAFPTPRQAAAWRPDRLQAACKVGYRAERIIRLAQAFEAGAVDPAWFESPLRSAEEVFEATRALHGFGPYAAANVLQLLGHYDHLPIDSETYRHYCHMTGTERPANPKTLEPLIHERYDPYRPCRFLAYWVEMWQDFERRYGPAWGWEPETMGGNFTASVLKKG